MFSVFPNLRVVSLRKNHLTSVRFLSKMGNSIEYLALGRNRIVDIASIYANGFNELTKINLGTQLFSNRGERNCVSLANF